MLQPDNVLKVEEGCLRDGLLGEEAQEWETLTYVLALQLLPRVPVVLEARDAERMRAEEMMARLTWEAQEEDTFHCLHCEEEESLGRLQLVAKEDATCLSLWTKFLEYCRKRCASAETVARRHLEADWDRCRGQLEERAEGALSLACLTAEEARHRWALGDAEKRRRATLLSLCTLQAAEMISRVVLLGVQMFERRSLWAVSVLRAQETHGRRTVAALECIGRQEWLWRLQKGTAAVGQLIFLVKASKCILLEEWGRKDIECLQTEALTAVMQLASASLAALLEDPSKLQARQHPQVGKGLVHLDQVARLQLKESPRESRKDLRTHGPASSKASGPRSGRLSEFGGKTKVKTKGHHSIHITGQRKGYTSSTSDFRSMNSCTSAVSSDGCLPKSVSQPPGAMTHVPAGWRSTDTGDSTRAAPSSSFSFSRSDSPASASQVNMCFYDDVSIAFIEESVLDESLHQSTFLPSWLSGRSAFEAVHQDPMVMSKSMDANPVPSFGDGEDLSSFEAVELEQASKAIKGPRQPSGSSQPGGHSSVPAGCFLPLLPHNLVSQRLR